jgi:hypothetical protein
VSQENVEFSDFEAKPKRFGLSGLAVLLSCAPGFSRAQGYDSPPAAHESVSIACVDASSSQAPFTAAGPDTLTFELPPLDADGESKGFVRYVIPHAGEVAFTCRRRAIDVDSRTTLFEIARCALEGRAEAAGRGLPLEAKVTLSWGGWSQAWGANLDGVRADGEPMAVFFFCAPRSDMIASPRGSTVVPAPRLTPAPTLAPRP